MDNDLLFITGVLSGIIVGFVISRFHNKKSRGNYGSKESFLEEISVAEHVFSLGDTLSKIAFKQYGDSRLWWVLAWFNTKPTDLHCEVGEIIYAPHPLEEVLNQMFNRIEI